MSRVVGVTGASGYIGRALLRHLRSHPIRVVSLGRSPLPGIEHRFADLTQPPAPDLLRGLQILVHLAADTSGTAVDPAAERSFAEVLARRAAAEGCIFVFVSSQTARADAPSAYGRQKAAIEAAVLTHGAVVVRPGLVYGGNAAGLYWMLLSMVRHLPLLPDLRPRPIIQPVHVDDLAQALMAAAHAANRGRVLCVAGPPLELRSFLAAIARYRLRRRRGFAPLPVGLARTLLRIASAPLGPRFSPERLDSLLALPSMQAGQDLERLGVELRPLVVGLSGRGACHRDLLREASLLARGAFGAPASTWLARRYVRALGAFGIVAPLKAGWGNRMAARWGALDSFDTRTDAAPGSMAWRISVLLRLAEADRDYVRVFLPKGGRVRVARDLLATMVLELRNRLFALFTRLAIRTRS